jgi:hypothetical protein
LLDLKVKYPFLKDAHSQPLQQTLNDLVKAYERAFGPDCLRKQKALRCVSSAAAGTPAESPYL